LFTFTDIHKASLHASLSDELCMKITARVGECLRTIASLGARLARGNKKRRAQTFAKAAHI